MAAPPPQAATARALIDIGAALAREVMGPLRLMLLFRLGSIHSRSGERLKHHVMRSPRALKPRSQGPDKARGCDPYRVGNGVTRVGALSVADRRKPVTIPRV